MALLTCSTLLKSQSTQTVDLSTGMVNGINAPLGSNDDTWTVKVPGTSSFISAGVSNNSVITNLNPTPITITYYNIDTNMIALNNYISPHTVTAAGPAFGYISANASTPAGTYQYKMNFTKFNCSATSVKLNVRTAGADNRVDSMSINGHMHDLSSYLISFSDGIVWPFIVNINPSELVSGTNTVIVYLHNINGPTAFFLNGNLAIQYAADSTLIPSITGPAAFCDGAPLSLTGSDGPSTSVNHYWEILECSSTGTITPGGFAWNSWYSGSPGSYTFPSSIGVPCGRYYKVKLALQNQCVNWVETTKIIRVNCRPIADAGSDITLCQGDCATIGAGLTMGRNTSYQWNGPSGVIGNSVTVNVCPATTTTYTFTVTNTLTGCTASDHVTVNVVTNSSAFSCYVDMTNPSYATVSLDAVYTQGYSTPGFYYSFSIEEMNGSVPYYTNTGTDAWWYYPNNKLRGFVSTGTGTYSQSAWNQLPTPPATDLPEGRFLYGHWYKITRTTWNQYCQAQTSYITINPVRSMIPADNSVPQALSSSLIVDKNVAETATSIQNQNIENSIYVYPNPSTGIFNIEVNSAEKTNIEVYDMLGKKIKSFELNNSRSTLDLTGSPKGMYMLRIISDGEIVNKKIILE
jgi:hypothetical protein